MDGRVLALRRLSGGGGGRGAVGGWGGWSPARLLHIPRPFLLGDN